MRFRTILSGFFGGERLTYSVRATILDILTLVFGYICLK